MLTEKILYEALVISKVKSSNIYNIGYDAAQKLLRIIFNSGATYDYYNVPNKVWLAFKKAKSKGSFAYHNICYKYNYERID